MSSNDIRAYNSLKRATLSTVGELLEYGADDLLEIKNLGNRCLEIIGSKLFDLHDIRLYQGEKPHKVRRFKFKGWDNLTEEDKVEIVKKSQSIHFYGWLRKEILMLKVKADGLTPPPELAKLITENLSKSQIAKTAEVSIKKLVEADKGLYKRLHKEE